MASNVRIFKISHTYEILLNEPCYHICIMHHCTLFLTSIMKAKFISKDMIYLTKSKPLCCPKPDQTIHFFADSALERAFGVGGILQNVGPCSSFLN